MSASFVSVNNDDVNTNAISNLLINSGQGNYSDVTSNSYAVLSDQQYVFCNLVSAGTVTLSLPSASVNYGKDLFIVSRNVNTSVSSSVANVIDIENDNASTPVTGILSGTGAPAWVHLVSNGLNWIAVSKNKLAPN